MIFFTVGITENKNNPERQKAMALAETFKQDLNHDQHIVCFNNPRFRRIGPSARRFATRLNKHIESKGLNKSSFTDIYLVGNNIGLRQRGRESQAQQIADALYKLGYHKIRVHALSNLQPANNVKVELHKEGDTLTLEKVESSKSRHSLNSDTAPAAEIKNLFDWDENTYWPKIVNHVVDEKKVHAISMISQTMVELAKRNQFQLEMQMRNLLNEIKPNYVTWKNALNIISKASKIKDKTVRAVLVSIINNDVHDPIMPIRNQIDKHIETLRKEQRANKYKLFSGHIGSYKLRVFTELRDVIANLYDIDEIYAEIKNAYISNSLLAFGKGCRSTQLIANILHGHPERGTTGASKLTSEDLRYISLTSRV